MSMPAFHPHTVSVSEATSRGISRLVRDAEGGEDVVVERHGKAVAAVVSMRHLEEIRERESDLQDAVLLLARAATDTGERTDLETVLTSLGFDRSELETGLETELTAGRE